MEELFGSLRSDVESVFMEIPTVHLGELAAKVDEMSSHLEELVSLCFEFLSLCLCPACTSTLLTEGTR